MSAGLPASRPARIALAVEQAAPRCQRCPHAQTQRPVACAPKPSFEGEPQLQGEASLLAPLLHALEAALGQPLQGQANRLLRRFMLRPGEAEVHLAVRRCDGGSELLATVFDALRARLPDTDILVLHDQ